jgi:CHASE3 domain sensor protein
MDLQIILVFILALLTVNLMLVGFYVITVLREFRETIKKSNEVLDDVHKVTTSVSSPISSLSGLVTGIAQGIKAVRSITTLRDISDSKKEDE